MTPERSIAGTWSWLATGQARARGDVAQEAVVGCTTGGHERVMECHENRRISALARDDDTAAIYRRYVALVRNRAMRLLGVEAMAQDVAQEAFVRLLKYRRKGEVAHNPAAFLYRTATNLALNRLRDTKRQQEILKAQHTGHNTGCAVEDRISLRRVLGLVGKEEALVASYYYIDGLEQEEIAELLGMQRRTVGRRLERFRGRARALLTDEKASP